MVRRLPFLALLLLAGAACADHGSPTLTAPAAPAAAVSQVTPARERLAMQLARALKDPTVRAAVKRRLDASNAPEGKLQFQALAQSQDRYLLAALARSGATTVADLLTDMDQARGLELYLPVPAQRAAWTGDEHYLVATIGNDHEAPIAFTPDGVRLVLDSRTPPAIPVLALVPQETDFTGGHPAMTMQCVDDCGSQGSGDDGTSGGTTSTSTGGAAGSAPVVPGLYLVQSHFNDTYESWLKGSPEFEYHVYGVDSSGSSVQLACTGETQKGAYYWDQNNLDWTGSAMLLSDADYNIYQSKHPGAPIRIVAWEDDNQSCVDHADSTSIATILKDVDATYKAVTSGKVEPWYARGIEAAPSIFSLITAAWNLILTNDDFIGNAVATSVAGAAPNGANWVLKSDGAATTGWFTTAHRP
ncbi:MAG TPA: hypothetical protein VHW65_02115 [Gemmatimonadales bacterium]|jgi:hypothetical protein|nr:hypothetical protein [Gemmatimonadales bacterium]